jgi:5'-nucleotidase
MPLILVTNDDGIHSPGLWALKDGLAAIGDVVVLAPERNWSASSHSKTMHKPLRVYTTKLPDGSPAYTCSGSPTDCVALALGGVLPGRPDVVVSGINAGHNLGIDITYSGTVACAMEAVIKGVPGVAVSSCYPTEAKADMAEVYKLAGDVARGVVQRVLRFGLPAHTLLNINVPGVAEAQLGGVRITRMGGRRYDGDEVLRREDPFGRPYYWLGGARPVDADDPATDVGAVKQGLVSVTPVTLDMTDRGFLAHLEEWGFQGGYADHGF